MLNTLDTGKRVPLLMLAMSLDIGGAETHIVGLSKALKRLGWPIYVASSGGRRVAELETAGISHIDCPLHSRSPLEMLKAYRILKKVINDLGINLVHAHARIPAFISEKITKRKGIPLVTTYHYTFVSGFPWNFFTRAGDLTIAVSQDIKEYVIREFGFHEDRVYVTPNGIDLDVFAPKPLEEIMKVRQGQYALSQKDGPILVYASRLQEDLADVALLTIDVVKRLSSEYPGIILFIAGDGPGLSSVEKRASSVNEAIGRKVVRPLGFVMDMAPLYAASDLAIGMSRVALEAMASGRPVIICGPLGMFGPVSPDNIDALEECNYTSRGAPFPLSEDTLEKSIRLVLSDEKRRKDLGTLGREVVAQKHSVDNLARQTEKIYMKALSLPRLI